MSSWPLRSRQYIAWLVEGTKIFGAGKKFKLSYCFTSRHL